MALFLYKYLTFWMPTPALRLIWIDMTPIARFLILGQGLLVVLIGAIPFGATVLAGPGPGLISLGLLFVTFLLSFDVFLTDEKALRLLHNEVKRFVNSSSSKK